MPKLSAYDTNAPGASDFIPILQGGVNKKTTVQSMVDRSSGPGLSIEFTSDANLTLTDAQGNANAIVFTDSPATLTTGRDVVFPDQFPAKLVRNSTAQTLTMKKLGQAGVAVAAGDDAFVASGVADVLKLTASASSAPAVSTVSSVSGTLTIDLLGGTRRFFKTTLTENVSTLAFSNLPAAGFAGEYELHITQDGTGSRTFSFPASHKALGGSDTTVATAANAVTVLSASTVDQGTTWRYAMQESA